MNNDFEHIDQLFRSRLKRFEVSKDKRPNKLWWLLSIKLILLNLSVSAMFFTGTVVLIIGGTAVSLIYNEVGQGAEAKENNSHQSTLSRNLSDEINALPVLKSPLLIQKNSRLEIAFRESTQKHKTFSPAIESLTGYHAGTKTSGNTDGSAGTIYLNTISADFDQTRNQNFLKSHYLTSGLSFTESKNKTNSERAQYRVIDEKALDSLLSHQLPNRRVSLEAYISPGIQIAKSETILSNNPGNLLMVKNDPNSFSLGVGANMRYHSGNWYFAAGIRFQYQQFKGTYENQLQQFDPDHHVLSFDTIIKFIYDPPVIGEPVIIRIDTTFISGYKTTSHTGVWKLNNQYIEFPLMVGYTHKTLPVHFDISSGISVGMMISQKGGIPAMDSEFNIIYQQPERSGYYVNYLLSAGITIPYRERIRLTLKPCLRYPLNKTTIDPASEWKSKSKTFDLQMGIIYEL